MRTWPALVVSGLAEADEGAGASRPELLQAALTEFDVAAVDEQTPDTWRVFFSGADQRDRAAASLRSSFPDLTFDTADVADEDWAARSQASLHAVQVGRIIVAPPWDVPLVVTIQPSMGFGTGHHATTRLCLAALQQLTLGGARVVDVGTGSGVLAIAASLLGAREVAGIDDDRDAVQAAWENLAVNTGATVTLLVGDLRTTPLEPADVILANLTGGLLLASADALRQLTAAHGRLILSGFQVHEERDVVAAFAWSTVEHRAEEGGWVCVTLRS